MNDGKNIGINFFAGSLTPNAWKNPSFNVIEFDAEYMIPINIKTYYLDLVQANSQGTASWAYLHDYLLTYSMTDLRPDNLMTLANSIKTVEQTAITYQYN